MVHRIITGLALRQSTYKVGVVIIHSGRVLTFHIKEARIFPHYEVWTDFKLFQYVYYTASVWSQSNVGGSVELLETTPTLYHTHIRQYSKTSR